MRWVVTVVVTAIAALTAATLVAGQTVPAAPAYRPVGTAQELELAGYAKILCSAVFVSGRDPAEATKNSGGDDKVAWHVDREQKLVRMTLGGVTNRVLRVMLHTRRSAEAWPQIPGVETRARSRKPRSERRTAFREPRRGRRWTRSTASCRSVQGRTT
jgi:hypothetical protein